MIIQLLLLMALNSLFIFGLKAVTYWEYNALNKPIEKKLLWAFDFYLQKYCKAWVHKPLISCSVCMSSFWGIMFFVGNSVFNINSYDYVHNITLCVLYCISLAGLNHIIYAGIIRE